jgi:LysR family transcriptional regulator of beta-lactamase
MGAAIARFEGGIFREVLTVSAVGTFAVGWLLPRLNRFGDAHPHVDLRLLTNNNKVDLWTESLDFAIRFGDGAWHGTHAELLLNAPLAPLCNPETAARLSQPRDLLGETLLRSYRAEDWPSWFASAGVEVSAVGGPVFDSSWTMAEAAMRGAGVALAPPSMFQRELVEGRLAQPFEQEISAGSYWLTWLKSRELTSAMDAFRSWITAQAEEAEAE